MIRQAKRFGLLRRAPGYAVFWSARTVSLFGDAIANVALVLSIAHNTTRGISASVAVGLLLLVQVVPRFLGPFAGALADRVDQRGLMACCDGGQALLFGLMAIFLPPLPVLLVLVACASVLATCFFPAGRSALPALVGKDDLVAANALLSSGFNLSLALGPGLGGLLVVFSGVRGALLLDALSFVCSAALLLRLPALLPAERGVGAGGWRSFFHETREGLLYLSRHTVARAVGISLFLAVALVAVDNVALVFFAENSLRSGALGFGLLSSVYGAGMVLAPLLVLGWKRKGTSTLLLLLGIGTDGLGTLLTGLAPILLLAALAQLLAGCGNGFENVGNNALIQQTVPRKMLGRVFGTVGSSTYIASGIAYVVGGPLLTILSARVIFMLAGAGVLVVCLLAWAMLPRSLDEYKVEGDNDEKAQPFRTPL
jgi:MFS family permease